jgi:hypothetical protein
MQAQRTSHERREAHQRLPVALKGADAVADITLKTRDDSLLESEIVVRSGVVPPAITAAVADLDLSIVTVKPQGINTVVVLT